jgi:hypothetical protein
MQCLQLEWTNHPKNDYSIFLQPRLLLFFYTTRSNSFNFTRDLNASCRRTYYAQGCARYVFLSSGQRKDDKFNKQVCGSFENAMLSNGCNWLLVCL